MKKLKLIAVIDFSFVLNSKTQNNHFSKSKKSHAAAGYSFSIDRTLIATVYNNSQHHINFNNSISKPSIFISLGGNRIYPFSKKIY